MYLNINTNIDTEFVSLNKNTVSIGDIAIHATIHTDIKQSNSSQLTVECNCIYPKFYILG